MVLSVLITLMATSVNAFAVRNPDVKTLLLVSTYSSDDKTTENSQQLGSYSEKSTYRNVRNLVDHAGWSRPGVKGVHPQSSSERR